MTVRLAKLEPVLRYPRPAAVRRIGLADPTRPGDPSPVPTPDPGTPAPGQPGPGKPGPIAPPDIPDPKPTPMPPPPADPQPIPDHDPPGSVPPVWSQCVMLEIVLGQLSGDRLASDQG